MLKSTFTIYKENLPKGMDTYNYTFKSVVFESVKIKKIFRSLKMVQKIICEKI